MKCEDDMAACALSRFCNCLFFFYGKTMKTIAYIDGENLHHGQLPEAVLLPNGRTIHRPPAWA